MATVDKHELLFSTDLKYFKALQLIGGKSIYDRFKIANASIIEKHIDEKYRYFLAYPVKQGDKIEFHGVKSRIDEPQILAEIEGDVAAKYQNLIKETLSHYQSRIDELKNIGKTKEAEFLTDAIKSVDDRFVFCYDGKVILGAWGMQIRENVREDITVIRKKSPRKSKNLKEEPEMQPVLGTPIPTFNVYFNAGDNGFLSGNDDFITKDENSYLNDHEIPQVTPKDGYEFIGWSETPNDCQITEDKEFIAQYRQVTAPPIVEPTVSFPWWKRFWLWLTALFAGKGCLTWLLRALLFLLLLLLLLWLLRECQSTHVGVGGGALGDNDSTWLQEDPNRGHDGGIYDPYNPYEPKPTPPSNEDILPPKQGVLPPVEGDPEIIPGNPSVIANRLNILMENEDKSILDLAKDFKVKYPDDKYKVVYYDDVVKRMQIDIPKEERDKLKEEIPSVFAPEYELFVFDEALFEGTYTPNDPAISDPSKSWYLKAINAMQGWDITRGSEKITVAIVDNGFTLSHPELKSKVVQPYNVWLHSQEIFPQDVDHGTHVAGTALAIADNDKGISGIAPACKFMPIQVADKRGMMTTTSVLDGIIYALYQGADVINVSLGSSYQGLENMPERTQKDLINNHFKEEERLWREIMRIAARHNSTIVVAAGNNNMLAGIDALQRPELFITVSAVDKNNSNLNKASFSNYGEYSTISAPGVGIYSCVGKKDYQIMDGTSMAAPVVAGAVALMKSLNDTITTKRIICVLKGTGLVTQGEIGSLIQLDKALESVQSGEETDCRPAPSTGDVQILLSWDNYNDLDLICTDPDRNTISYKNRRVLNGGQLEIDMNVEYPDSNTPIENIYWPSGGAPNGTYNVYIQYFRQHRNTDGNPYKITVKYGENTEEYSGTINNEKETIHICTFTLGNAGSVSNPPNASPDNPNTPPTNDRRTQLEQERDRLQRELDRINEELRRIRNSR